MAGLPKKYAKLGFKKGWAAYKKTSGYRTKAVRSYEKTKEGRRTRRAFSGLKAYRTSRPRKAKTMARRRDYGRKRGGSRKFSMWGLLKGAVYTGAIVVPIYGSYKASGGGAAGAEAVMREACFHDSAGWNLGNGLKIWGPVGALAVIDFVTTKIPIQRQISRGVNRIMR